MRQDLGNLGAGFLLGGPEHGAVVQVQDGVLAFAQLGAGPCLMGFDVRLAAGFLAQAGHGGPEDPGTLDGLEIQLVGLDLQVRRRGEAAVEIQRKIVGRLDRTKVTAVGYSFTGVTNESSTLNLRSSRCR